MPALQNEDDISAVVLGLRKGIIPGQDAARREAARRRCLCRDKGALKAVAKREHRTCVWGAVHTAGAVSPAKSPACGTPVPASSRALLIIPGTQRASCAGTTGNQDRPPLLWPFQNRGFVLSLRRIMSLSPGTH